MTSANLGQVEWSATYRPFGEVHATTGTESLSLRFPGQFFDPETRSHQNWHRDYDPRLGRYLQSDPIDLEGGLNTYAYVGGNPVNLIDPEGLVAPAIPAILACLTNPSCALPAIGTAWLLCEAAGDFVDQFLNEGGDGGTGGDANRPRPYADRTPADRPQDYRPARDFGPQAQENIKDGSIWDRDRDRHGGSEWKRWPNKRDRRATRNRESVRRDGSVR
jgi:RHS repeat-associated protein